MLSEHTLIFGWLFYLDRWQWLKAVRTVIWIWQWTPVDPKTLLHDLDLQDILSINLTRAIQFCMDIRAHIIASQDVTSPDTMGQTFDIPVQADIIEDKLGNQIKESCRI